MEAMQVENCFLMACPSFAVFLQLMKMVLAGIAVFACLAGSLSAQLSLQVGKDQGIARPKQAVFQPSLSNSPFQSLLPNYVKENPRGYSPLCRLELDIEDRLPVGVWMKLEDQQNLDGLLRQNAYVRFKLFKF
jgi:hypothetical protein